MSSGYFNKFLLGIILCLSTQVYSFENTTTFQIDNGIIYTHLQIDSTCIIRNYNILKLDNSHNEYEIQVAIATSALERPSSMSNRANAIAGINGGYFESNGDHVGLIVQNGFVINSTHKMSPSRGSIGFGLNNKVIIDRVDYADGIIKGLNDTDWSGITNIVSAGPIILWNGKVQPLWTDNELNVSFSTSAHARTAVGYTKDTEIIFVVVDGYQPGLATGISLNDLAQFMKSLGCINALNLDGGGSSTMVIRDTVINCPSDESKPGLQGKERAVSNSLLITRKAQ